MNYYASEIKDYTFIQLKNISSEWEKDSFYKLCLECPLIFVKRSHGIIFFNLNIELDQMEYNFLYELVKNATKSSKNKGLSPIKLFKLLGCKHKKEHTSNKNYNIETEEYDRANERMRDIKRRIRANILKYYMSLKKVANYNKLGIYEVNQGYKIAKYLNGEYEISEDSPYYNFEIESALDSLIYNQIDKNKKYTTEFIFQK